MNLLSWLTGTHNKTTEIIITQQLTTKEKFNSIISDTVKPFLKANGFTKKALTFYKKQDNLIFVINFQNSQGNNLQLNQFYINCGIYSKTIDIIIGKDEMLEPKEYDCHYRVRISRITKNQIDEYKIFDSTDLEIIKEKLLNDLGITVKLFEGINTITDLTDLMINNDCYNNKLFIYFILTKDWYSLKKQVNRLNEVLSKESRWPRVKNNLNQLLKDYNQQTTIDKILE
jgi:hypothetical protein